MQNCDEILIEVSREQATYSEGNASWTVEVPSIVLEPNDQIQALGCWLSVRNSGDNSIELFDENNPNDEKMNGSFDVNLWKTMDAQNVVAFPYHSMKWSNERNHLGGGFAVPAYCVQDTKLQFSSGTPPADEPKFTYTNSSGTVINNKPVSSINTYSTLLNYKNSDEYHFHFDLFDEYGTKGYSNRKNFVQNNASLGSDSKAEHRHPQGMRDEANTGNRYCVMWRQYDGTYIRHSKRVNIEFPIGYYTPENIASFISDQLNLIYYQRLPENDLLKETWTNSFRYFEALYPVAIPQINITTGLSSTNMLTTMNSSFFDNDGKTSPTWKSTGFARNFSGNQTTLVSVTGTQPTQEIVIQFHPYSTTDYHYDNLLYLEQCTNNFSGTQGSFVNSWAYQRHAEYTFLFNPVVFIESIRLGAGTATEGIFGHIQPTLGNTAIYYEPSVNAWRARITIITQNTSTPILSSALDGATNFSVNIYWGCQLPSDPIGGSGGNTRTMNAWMTSTHSGTSAICVNCPPSMPIFVGWYEISSANQEVWGLAKNNATRRYMSPPIPYTYCPIGQMEKGDTNIQYTTIDPHDPRWAMDSTIAASPSASTDADIPTLTNGIGYTIDYANGNASLGGTYGNFYRWSLRNWEEPPFVPYNSRQSRDNDKDYPLLMPILRKYPLFTEYGMKLNTSHANPGETAQQIYMYPFSLNFSTLKLQPIDQFGTYLIEHNPISTREEIRDRCKLWYDFIKAQIDDGLTRTDNMADVPEDRDSFTFFTHIVIETSMAVDDPFGFADTAGTDKQLRNRARGLVCLCNRDNFNKASATDNFDSTTNEGSFYGIKYQYIHDGHDNYHYYIKIDCYSWIYDKLGGGVWGGNANYGFNDYNNCESDVTLGDTLVLTGTIGESVGSVNHYRVGMGFCYKKSSWRNYTAMLSSYTEKDQNPSYLFSPQKNRMAKAENDLYGDITYSSRVGIGAKNPALVFDSDGSSRFYWQQFFFPQTVTNRWFDGITNTDNPIMISNVNFPIFTWTYQTDSKKLGTDKQRPDFTSGFSISTTEEEGKDDDIAYSNDFPSNVQVSDDCVYYNQSRWNLENDGLFQLAIEYPKHICFGWQQDGGHNSGLGAYWSDWNYITGGTSFMYQYPVDTNYSERFFCFDQNARFNSWTSVFEGTAGKSFYPDKSSTTQISSLGLKGIVPVAFWGMASGNQMIIKWDGSVIIADRQDRGVFPENDEPFSQNGTVCPDPKSIYAERSGISIDTWYVRNNELMQIDTQAEIPIDTYTNSIWNILGFSYTDLLPNPYQYCNQTRNITINFLSDNTNVDDVDIQTVTHYVSRPMTTQANIPTNFNIVQGNRLNTIQDTPQYPSLTYISKIGISAINRDKQIVSVVCGGVVSAGATVDDLTADNLQLVSSILGGVSYLNQQLIDNQFYILVEQSENGEAFGTKIYSDGLASKIDSPFYLVRSDLPEDNFKYVNNAGTRSIMPVVSVANKQYGATTDFYYSDSEYMTFINKRKRTITNISVEITDSGGNLATVLEPKSTIFFRIIRSASGELPQDNDLMDDLPRLEDSLNKKQKELLQAQIKQLITKSKL